MENINKIQIVPDEVYEIGANKAPVIPEWSVKDDSTLLQKVKALAHSTFDRSKFTVVGTPTITDDGIASGFSGSNFVKVIKSLSASTDFEFEFIYNANSGIGAFFSFSGISVYINVNNEFQAYQGDNYSTTFTIDTAHAFKIKVTNDIAYNRYVIRGYSLDGSLLGTINWSYSHNDFTQIVLGGGSWNSNILGSIDLKQFSITADGVEVFSGNKTGIETIKPDNYTAVGTPTISADGVLIGADASNYIKTAQLDLRGSDWDYIVPINLKTDSLTTSCQLLYTSENLSLFTINKTLHTYFYLGSSASVSHTSNNTVPLGRGFIKFSRKGTAYTIKYSTDKENWITIDAITDNTDPYANNIISIGGGYTPPGLDPYAINGNEIEIDLNGIQFYKDGNLVYQPCLKIPYTEGQNYVKVVDKLYRDRVKDLFEQKGYNGYYTIGEDDFTLPSNKWSDVIEHKENGLTVAEQRVDQTLTIRGACEQGVDVNLPMEFFSADSYAVFGVGTTGTNTASKFTPAADGNYIAIGKGKV